MIKTFISHGEKIQRFALLLFTLLVTVFTLFLLLLFTPCMVAYAEEGEEYIESEETYEDNSGDYISDNDDTYSDSEQNSEENNSEDVEINIITDDNSEETEEDKGNGVNINLITEEGTEVVEILDEEGNVIGYTVKKAEAEETEETEEADEASTEATYNFEEIEKHFLVMEDSFKTMEEKTASLLEICFVLAVMLGGTIVYLFVHWSMKRKGVLE